MNVRRGNLTMKRRILAVRGLFLLFWALTISPCIHAAAQPAERWVGTWSASPEAQPNTSATFGKVDKTYREVVHVSVGGATARIVLTNELGLEPLTIGAATIAISAGGSAVDPSTM